MSRSELGEIGGGSRSSGRRSAETKREQAENEDVQDARAGIEGRRALGINTMLERQSKNTGGPP